VREYVVHRVLDQEVDWFVLEGDRYRPLAPGADGLFKSTIFPGLWLDAAAVVQGDLAGVLHVPPNTLRLWSAWLPRENSTTTSCIDRDSQHDDLSRRNRPELPRSSGACLSLCS
jgi:hypothetical protein